MPGDVRFLNTRSCPLGCLPSPALSPWSGSPAVPINWHLAGHHKSQRSTILPQKEPLPCCPRQACTSAVGPSLPSVLTRQPASAWSQESGPPRQGGQTEERCFLTCLATTYHPHQDLNESGRGSDSLETRHTPGLLRGRMHGCPTEGSLLWTGPAPPLLTFRNMPVGKDLSDHTSPLCHLPALW